MNLGRLFRTIRHLRPIQVLNRLTRKLPHHVSASGLPKLAAGVREPAIPFPEYYTTCDGAAFTFLNETHAVASRYDWSNPDWPKLWLYNLHYFDCLRQPSTGEGLPAIDEPALISRWIEENPPSCRGNGWEPYPLSLRIVNWLKWHLSSRGCLDDAMVESLALQVRYLCSQLEYHLLANHLLANAKALVFAGVCFRGKDAESWYKRGMSIYRRELPEQILPDGAHFELSPMYHSIVLEDILDVVNLLRVGNDRDFFIAYARRMVPWLHRMTGPDGRITFFNDAAFGIALSPPVLFDYAAKLFSDCGQPAADGGNQLSDNYQRIAWSSFTLFADIAEIGPAYQPGHAHADSLTFELFDGQDRIFVNSGTSRYGVSPERMEERGTAAHNCLVLDGCNSSEVWGGHRVGARAHIVERRMLDDGSIAAAHDGYRPVMHRRTWHPLPDGLEIVDELSGAPSGAHEVAVYFHLAPGHVVKAVDGRHMTIGGKYLFEVLPTAASHSQAADFSLPQATASISHFSPEFGRITQNAVIVVKYTTALPSRVSYRITHCI